MATNTPASQSNTFGGVLTPVSKANPFFSLVLAVQEHGEFEKSGNLKLPSSLSWMVDLV